MDSNFTKKAVLFSFFGLAITTMSAQQLKKIGGNPYNILPSAVFEIESSSKGFLMPRMDTSQRTGIISPAEGLQVYDTDTKTIWNYNGTVWINSVSNNLPSAQVFVGDINGEAAAVELSGAVTIGNTGLVAITTGAITNAKLDKANIPLSGFAAAAADVDLGTSFKLINVLDPTLAQDAATKNYVDTRLNSSNVLANKNVFVGDINGEAAAVALSERCNYKTQV
jgi:hypothetical protein